MIALSPHNHEHKLLLRKIIAISAINLSNFIPIHDHRKIDPLRNIYTRSPHLAGDFIHALLADGCLIQFRRPQGCRRNRNMDSSEGPRLSPDVTAGLIVDEESSLVDSWPLYVRELIAGGAAGGVAKTAVAPLERIKILFQTRPEGFHSLGVYKSLKRVLNHEGVKGLYKGNGASVLRIVPYAALHYMTYEQYRFWLWQNCPSLGTGPIVDLLAGSAAGGTAVLCTYPLDLARTKLAYQVDDRRPTSRSNGGGLHLSASYQGIQDVFRRVYSEGGVRGLYRGVGPTLAGILPYAGLKFYIYEALKRRVPEEKQKSILLRLSCGAIAGLVGQTFTYPLDVVRRQMQVENLLPTKVRYRSTREGLTSITCSQGWRQLFAGLSINYIKVVPSVAIGFTAYDIMKSWLNISSQQRRRAISGG